MHNIRLHLASSISHIKAVRWSTFRGKAYLLFMIIGLAFGLLFALKTPLLWGGDETTHYARAFQIAEGNAVSDRLPYPWGDYSYGGEIPATVHALIMHVNDDITSDTRATSFGTKRINDPSSAGPLANQKLGSATKTYFFPNSAPYSPVAYIPSALALKIAKVSNMTVGQSILMARIFGLVFFVGCVSVALYILRRHLFAWVLFAVGLVPMVLFQSSIISGDTMANGLAILLVALVAKGLLTKKLATYEASLLLATTVMLPLVKPTYVFIALAPLLISSSHFSLHPKLPARWLKFGVIGLAIALLAAWTYLTKDVSEAIRLIGTGPRWTLISPGHQLVFMLHNPLQFLVVTARTVLLQDNNFFNGMFGQLGFIFVQVPAVSIVSSVLAITLAVGIADRFTLTIKQLLFGGALVGAGIMATFVTFYLTFSNVAEPIIEGVQGRYFLPFASLVLLLLCALTAKLRLEAVRSDEAARKISTAIVCLCVISLSAAAAKFFYVLLG
jgi:uncharacterized membrane protein